MEVPMQLMDKSGLIAAAIPLGPPFEDQRQDDHRRITSEVGFRQVIGMLRRRRRLILAVMGLGTILAGITGLLISPKYTATAQLVQVQGATSLSPEALQQAVDTQVTMLTSPYHLQHVLDSFRNDPRFSGLTSKVEADSAVAPAQGQSETSEPGSLGLKELKRRLGVWIGPLFRHKRAGAGLTFDDLQRRLQVLQERRSRIINVAFQWGTPERAADIVNRIVELYVQSNAEQQRAYTANELARLDQRIATVNGDIERTSAALHKAIQRRSDPSRSAATEEQEADLDPRELERRTAASAQLYASLLLRQKEIREQNELVNPDISILSLASPPSRPSSPNPILFIIPALIVSLICGSFAALALERLDNGLRSETEVADAAELSCIGLVPRIPPNRLTRSIDYLRREPFSPYAEGLRSAVAALQLAEPGHAKAVLISSSIAGEGKTTLARGLAAYVGLLGRHVLLIAIDRQTGKREGGEFDDVAERQIVGLQNRSLADSIRPVPQAGFDHVRIAGHRPDPASTVGEVANLLRQIRDRYDCIIIDGPPVFATVEARLLPSIADKLLFVVKWGSTRREFVQNAVGMLRNAGRLENERTDFAAAIVAQVDLKRHAQYRYGDSSEFVAGAPAAPRVGLVPKCLAFITRLHH
jgi:polysaccharide biosynthesis transport protein